MSDSHPFLKELFASSRRYLLTIAVFSFFVNILMLLVPMYLLQLYDRVLPSRNVDTLMFLTGIVLAGLLVMTLLDAIRGLVLVRFGTWFDDQVASHLLSGTVARSLRRQRRSSNNIFNDLATVRSFFSGSNLLPLLDAPWSVVFIGVLFMLHPIIGGLTLVGAVLLFLLAIGTELLTRYHVQRAQQVAGVVNGATQAFVRDADTVEAMGMRGSVARRWRAMNRQALDAHEAASVRSVWAAAGARLLRQVLQVAVIGAAAWLVLQNTLTAGALVASMLLMRRALAPFDRAVASWKAMLNARRAYRRINRRLDESPTLARQTSLPAPSGRIKVDNVSFRHRGHRSRTLRDITFRIQPGQVICLVGPTAAGKTTLAKILVGVLKPMSGKVYWGRSSLHDWDSDDLGAYVGYLPQDLSLFAGSVADNISRLTDNDKEGVIAAAQLAGVDGLIESLPHGYDTSVGDDGIYLSGGQQQLIGLARAVYGDVRLVVLDEPDSNLDGNGRKILAEAVERLKERGVMVLIISHRTSGLRYVDQYLAVDGGRLKLSTVGADGRHSEKPDGQAPRAG